VPLSIFLSQPRRKEGEEDKGGGGGEAERQTRPFVRFLSLLLSLSLSPSLSPSSPGAAHCEKQALPTS